jgi:AraC-like DNA-binding protein/quercetin dioxygenase-like cupin family protein
VSVLKAAWCLIVSTTDAVKPKATRTQTAERRNAAQVNDTAATEASGERQVAPSQSLPEHDHHSPSAALAAHPQVAGVTLFSAPLGAHEHAVHAHEAFSVIAVVTGSKRFYCAGTECDVHAGEIAVANPGQLHGCGPLDGSPWAHRTCYLSAKLVGELAASMGWRGPVVLRSPKIVDSQMWKLLCALHDDTQTEEPLGWQSAALETLARLVEAHGSRSDVRADDLHDSACHQRFSACAEMMMAHLSARIDLAQLAAASGVSPSQVIRDFKRAVDSTPAVYLRQLRLTRAKALINSGSSLLDAALATGFSDQSHFSRCFRGAYGVTPGQFHTLSKGVNGDTAF